MRLAKFSYKLANFPGIDATTVQQKAQYPDKIIICFAVMEIENWFLAMYEVFQKLDERLNNNRLPIFWGNCLRCCQVSY
ncbi:hypothetical protein QUF76_16265 [Desulfobacterales bacterium HSG16]|nr:hypothetical protein [Desulfobacterales bacterium HSG16]